jgi:putative salt-induced outer membrane protein
MPLFQGFSRQLGCLVLRVSPICAVVLLVFCTPGAGAQEGASPPDLGWDFEIALGGSFATGNTDRQALDLETKVKHRVERREDRFKLLSNLARENKATTAERIQAIAQTNYDISKDKFYVLAFAQYDRDRFSGFRYEAEVGPGLGYRFIYTEKLTFSLEFSPGYRHGELRLTGRNDDKFFARGTSTIEYKLSDNARLSNETLVTGDASRVKIENTFAVTSTLIRSLAARISFNYRTNSNPPAGVEKTDTLSKVSLVYSF